MSKCCFSGWWPPGSRLQGHRGHTPSLIKSWIHSSLLITIQWHYRVLSIRLTGDLVWATWTAILVVRWSLMCKEKGVYSIDLQSLQHVSLCSWINDILARIYNLTQFSTTQELVIPFYTLKNFFTERLTWWACIAPSPHPESQAGTLSCILVARAAERHCSSEVTVAWRTAVFIASIQSIGIGIALVTYLTNHIGFTLTTAIRRVTCHGSVDGARGVTRTGSAPVLVARLQVVWIVLTLIASSSLEKRETNLFIISVSLGIKENSFKERESISMPSSQR